MLWALPGRSCASCGTGMAIAIGIWTTPGWHGRLELKSTNHQSMAKTQAERLFKKQNGRCPWCGHVMSLTAATKEHIWPKLYGGTNDESNLALAHKNCNEKRNSNLDYPVHPSPAFNFIRDIIRRIPR